MADFVAVIKRAVDGLAEKSPAMRTRVYDKARTAVRRQLEGMSPKPSEAAIETQLAKLESAIDTVEADYAEPVLDDLVFEELEPESAASPPQEAPPAEEAPSARDAQAGISSEETVPPETAEVSEPEPERDDIAPAAQDRDETPAEDAPDAEVPDEQAHETVSDAPTGETSGDEAPPPAEAPAGEHGEKPRPAGPAPVPFGSYAIGRAASFPVRRPRDGDTEPAASGGFQPSRNLPGFGARAAAEDPPAAAAQESLPAAEFEAGTRDDTPPAEPVAAVPLQVEPAADTVPAMPADEPGQQQDLADHSALYGVAEDEIFDDGLYADQATGQEPEAADYRDRTQPEPVEETALPVVKDGTGQLPEGDTRTDPVHAGIDDSDAASIFEQDYAETVAVSADDGRDPAAADPVPVDHEGHDETFGFAAGDDRLEGAAGERDRLSAAPPSGTRAAPVAANDGRRRGRGRLVAGLVALLLLGGAGYAAWSNQDALVALFSPEPAAEDVAETADDPPPADTEEEDIAAVDPQAGDPQAVDPEPEPADDPAPAVQKFTQRLLPNGTEIDEGPAELPDQPVPGEGRSLSVQTDEGEDDAAAPSVAQGEAITEEDIAASDAADEETVETAEAETGEAAAGETPLGVGQTMFLYEERLGQLGPTALEGSVQWSIVSESPGGDAPPESAIRGEINVPEKELTALITIKRNTDTSLPASHLIEIVFSLPGNFEGGGIDTVQRVAFKATEEDRGNELIGVPAKITDDFFMVALNDYAEALSTNLRLMREREWIDIPVVYGNGRRALITLDKGSSGADVFNRALSEWQRRTGNSAG